MPKKYVVGLTDVERATPVEPAARRCRRPVLDGRADRRGRGGRTQTVENIRERLVTSGLEVTLEGPRREHAPRPKSLDGEPDARVIAMRLGPPPKGFANGSLRLLAGKVVELGLVESIRHETVRQTLKEADRRAGRSSIG